MIIYCVRKRIIKTPFFIDLIAKYVQLKCKAIPACGKKQNIIAAIGKSIVELCKIEGNRKKTKTVKGIVIRNVQ